MIIFLIVYALIISYVKHLVNCNINDKLYEVTAFNSHERSVLYTMSITNDSVIFLNSVTNEAAIPMHIIVNSHFVKTFENTLQNEGIEYKMYDTISSIIKDYTLEEKDISVSPKSNGFLTWQELSMWVEQKQKKYTIMKKEVISNTYERRELFIVSVNKNLDNPAVVIVGGEQARDWISPKAIQNFINALLEDKCVNVLLDYYNFYFLPIFNPDGYVYSMEHERFWNKNRKVFFPKKICYAHDGSEDIIAVGVNVERNWYFQNSLSFGDGTECSSVYLGHKPLSEEETKALADFLNVHATKIMAFMSIKGFGGKLITLPYADNLQTNNHGALMEIVLAACEKVYQNHNATYYQGTTGSFFYNFTGNSADWVKRNLNIPIVTTIHLKFKEEHFPHALHIELLSKELITIVKEILTISQEIYRPLFNQQIMQVIQYRLLLLLILLNFN